MKMIATHAECDVQRATFTYADAAHGAVRLTVFDEEWMHLACRQPRAVVREETARVAQRTPHQEQSNDA